MSAAASTAATSTGPVVVLGAGISGLAAAHRALELDPRAEVTVLEASERAGGWIGSIERDGFVIERGADSILAQEPSFFALIERLGLTSRLVRTRSDRRGAYVLRAGALTRIPEGWSLLGPSGLGALANASLLSVPARLRVLGDLVIARGEGGESLAGFARRRLGWEALERLGQPLASGIYGSDAESLGLGATLPRFAKLEAEHGSVMRGLAAEHAPSSDGAPLGAAAGARYGLFVAFDRGMGVLVDALASRLGARLCLGEAVQAVRRAASGYEVRTARRTLAASRVIVALQGPAASTVLRGLDGELGRTLEGVPHASATTVTFAFDRRDVAHPLDAYGVVVPAVERRRMLAMTWASEKWPGRAPEGSVLIRVFVAGPGEGNAGDGSAARELTERSDEALARTALREIRALLGVRGEPRFALVSRFPQAMPRYLVGHASVRARVAKLLARHPGLFLASNTLNGVGIPAAILSGERAGEQAARTELAVEQAS